MKRVKSFEITAQGERLFRPFGMLGATWAIPDDAGFSRAKVISYTMVAIVFLVALANIFHRNPWITVIAILALLGAFLVWLEVAKKNWKRIDRKDG